jgi:hypothetical protein
MEAGDDDFDARRSYFFDYLRIATEIFVTILLKVRKTPHLRQMHRARGLIHILDKRRPLCLGLRNIECAWTIVPVCGGIGSKLVCI